MIITNWYFTVTVLRPLVPTENAQTMDEKYKRWSLFSLLFHTAVYYLVIVVLLEIK